MTDDDRRERYAGAIDRAWRGHYREGFLSYATDAAMAVADAELSDLRHIITDLRRRKDKEIARLRKIAEENKQHYVDTVRDLRTAEAAIERVHATARWYENAGKPYTAAEIRAALKETNDGPVRRGHNSRP